MKVEIERDGVRYSLELEPCAWDLGISVAATIQRADGILCYAKVLCSESKSDGFGAVAALSQDALLLAAAKQVETYYPFTEFEEASFRDGDLLMPWRKAS